MAHAPGGLSGTFEEPRVLPYSWLIDREGRVLQRWIGYAGEDQIDGIRAVVLAELLRGADDATAVGGSGSGAHGGH